MNFSYLETPAYLYKISPKPDLALVNTNGKVTRRLYYNVPYTSHEENHMIEFKKYAHKQGKEIDCSEQHILRYLYSTSFSYKDALEKMETFMEWCHNPVIQNLSQNAIKILEDGAIYTYGRDRNERPMVVMDFSKIDLGKFELAEYYCAINAVISVVARHCFIKGVIETYLFIIDMGGKNFTSMPLQAIGSIIKKLSVVYSMFLGEMLVLNTQYFIKLSYFALKGFISEETRKKIHLLDCNELEKIYQFVDPSQLPSKHKGYNPNPDKFWPPIVPGQNQQNLDSQTVYYSVMQDNESFFKQDYEKIVQISQKQTCCSKDDCRLF